ncbi:DUF2325 domain-containing protein [Anaerocolumna xylanovorans]|uniref:DUF2325 domain-containing protein n=1 Tax=Anaerocolumna xylanovorans DSM 12503 TaxID=1121345 RepID=A0A1M7Y503_9FIRM|nr:DUF2325 domain-containing protein [Anaerocolumna xylanovorans]SHO47292.1 hypothetical protein SAMN02745217_01493 [Anaerocolumna xylanovorans DSM 12503]
MSVVIVGGHDRMVCTYKEICKQHNCKAKVFTQMPANFKTQVGSPDLLILFTNTVSHKMVVSALKAVDGDSTIVERCHSSSACALKDILCEYCKNKNKEACL